MELQTGLLGYPSPRENTVARYPAGHNAESSSSRRMIMAIPISVTGGTVVSKMERKHWGSTPRRARCAWSYPSTTKTRHRALHGARRTG